MLFNLNELAEPIPTPDEAEGDTERERLASIYPQAPQPTYALLGRVSDTVQQKFPKLERGITYHYATAGLWSNHDLLIHLLGLIGPARVSLATWSMTEEPVRMIVSAMNEGMITDLQALLDVRVRVRNPKVLAFAKQNMARVREVVCHAKVTVLENDDWQLAIIGSANYTNNPRIEAGVIAVSPEAARFHRRWIEEEIDHARTKGSPFADRNLLDSYDPKLSQL